MIMPTKQELKDGPFIIKKIGANDLNANSMSPLDYFSLSGLEETKIMSIVPLRDISTISAETKSSFDEGDYDLVNLKDIDKTIGEIANIYEIDSSEILSSKSKFYFEDIIFSKLRPYINNVAIVNIDYDNQDFFIGSSELIRIKTDVNPYYLLLALRSKFTLYQTSASGGSIRPRFNIDKIESLEIPIFNDVNLMNAINSTVKELFDIRKSVKSFITTLIKKYDEMINIGDINKLYIKRIPLNEINVSRMDANYYLLEYIQNKMLENENCIRLGDLIKFSDVKINTHYGADDIIKYITTSDVDLNQGEIINWEEKVYKPTSSLVWNKAPNRAKMLLDYNQILIPYLKGGIGTVGWVPEDLKNYIGSNGFAVIESVDDMPGLLYIIFRSNLVSSQLKLIAAGTIMEDINDADIENVLVLLPDDNVCSEISNVMSKLLPVLWSTRKLYMDILESFEELCISSDVNSFNEFNNEANQKLNDLRVIIKDIDARIFDF